MVTLLTLLLILATYALLFILKTKKSVSLNKQMITAAVCGIVIGVLLKQISLHNFEVINSVALLKFIYSVYINLLLFTVAPLIFFSIINSIINIKDFDTLKRIGIKVIIIFAGTAFIASIIGLGVATFMQDFFSSVSKLSAREINNSSLLEYLLQLVPRNIFADLGNNRVIAIVFAAIVFGSVIVYLKEQIVVIKTITKEINSILFKIVGLFIMLTPYSIVAIVSYVVVTYGWQQLLNLFPFVIAVYIAMLIHFVFVYGTLVKKFANLNFIKFLKKGWVAIFFAFNSSSSVATIPVTISSAESMGVSKKIVNIIPSIGATMNMNACGAIFPSVVAIFTAQIFNIDLNFISYCLIILMSVVASLGTAGVPGAAVVTTTLVLSSVGLPLEGLLMVLTIDRLVDMGRTAVNVTGDLVASVVIAQSEKELNRDVFYN